MASSESDNCFRRYETPRLSSISSDSILIVDFRLYATLKHDTHTSRYTATSYKTKFYPYLPSFRYILWIHLVTAPALVPKQSGLSNLFEVDVRLFTHLGERSTLKEEVLRCIEFGNLSGRHDEDSVVVEDRSKSVYEQQKESQRRCSVHLATDVCDSRAMHSKVLSLNSCLMVCWIFASVARSTA
jgi:hypothetical protein